MEKETGRYRTVQVPTDAYGILKAHAAKTGKKLTFLIARAIERCYGGESKVA